MSRVRIVLKEEQGNSPPGMWWASGALMWPHCLVAFVTLLSFLPYVLEPVLMLGSRPEGGCCCWKWLSWSRCRSAEWKAEPELSPTCRHQVDGSRSRAVHCYPHFSVLCGWEARCTDWIPLGSSGELESLTEDAPQSHMCLRGFTLSRLCLLQTTDFTPASYATEKKEFKASTFILGWNGKGKWAEMLLSSFKPFLILPFLQC